jgi:hypothetical protein
MSNQAIRGGKSTKIFNVHYFKMFRFNDSNNSKKDYFRLDVALEKDLHTIL